MKLRIFKKINKNDKPLVDLSRKKKRIQINKIINEKKPLQLTPHKYKGS